MTNKFVQIIADMLLLAKQIIASNPSLVNNLGRINSKGQEIIEMDVKIEKALINFIKKQNLSANIYSEEIGFIKSSKEPQLFITFDPLDGSTNYQVGKGLLPFGVLIAIFNKPKPRLKDVITAGALEYTQNLAWTYDGRETKELNGKDVKLKNDWTINMSTPVYLDLYRKNRYEQYRPLAEQIFVRNTGSTIGNLSYVLANAAAGLGHAGMRGEEVGAVYSLIKGAGGTVVNHRGVDIGEEAFDYKAKYELLAGSKNTIEFMVDKLSNNH